MILPRVKNNVQHEGVWTPKKTIVFSVNVADALGEKAVRAVEYFLPSNIITVGEENADVKLVCVPKAPTAEWYRLTTDWNGVTVEYADARGAINAMASLAQLVLEGEIGAGVIEDYPDFSYRSLMLDLARGLREPLQDIKDVIVYMALTKYNYLHLHLQDSQSLCYKSDAAPGIAGSQRRNGRQYTKVQLRELVDFCEIFEIEVIPEIEVPAHAGAVLRAYPQFRCEVDPVENTSLWCVCPTHEELFAMYEGLIRELCEIFPGKYIHIGADELEFRGRTELNQFCYWRECPRCQKLREEKGFLDIREQFYYVIQRVYDIVKACGKSVMMWSEQIDIAKECPLPKDILIHFWRVASSVTGPKEGCSMEGFAKQGYSIVNSYYPQTYIDFDSYLKEENLCKWNPVTDPEIYEDGQKYVTGGEMCAWEYGHREAYDFYDYTIPMHLPLFADRLWRSEPVEYTKEYRKDVYKTVFGKYLENELYPIIGAIVPPRKKSSGTLLSYLPLEEIDNDYIALCVEELSAPATGVYQKMRLEYIKLLQRIALEQFKANRAAVEAAKAAVANVAVANA